MESLRMVTRCHKGTGYWFLGIWNEILILEPIVFVVCTAPVCTRNVKADVRILWKSTILWLRKEIRTIAPSLCKHQFKLVHSKIYSLIFHPKRERRLEDGYVWDLNPRDL